MLGLTEDGTFVEGQSTLARYLARSDRRLFVRHPDECACLASNVFSRVELHVTHDLLKIPVTHVIMRCGNSIERMEGAPR